MINVILKRDGGYQWYNNASRTIWAKGFIVLGNKVFKGQELVARLDRLSTPEELKECLKSWNGLFSGVIVKPGFSVFFVDTTRTFSLLFKQCNEGWVVTDEMETFKNNDDFIQEELHRAEMLSAGFISGSDTLICGINQVQAGELIQISGSYAIRSDYFLYPNAEYTEGKSEDIYRSELLKIFENLSVRFTEQLAGRKVLLPLSGGMDSRLIAVMLKQANYRNVVCFTYGHPESFEVRRSRKIARKLGFPWYFVRYDKQIYEGFCKQREFKAYTKYASNYQSLFSMQDYFALKELSRRGVLSGDEVIVPGHAGDFIAGSHLKKAYLDVSSFEEWFAIIKKKHYSLNRVTKEAELSLKLKEQLKNNANWIQRIEMFDWRERQCKYIVNACQTYAFWGFSFLLPLWDRELVTFFSHLPLDYKWGKRLYNQVLMDFYFIPYGVHFETSWREFVNKKVRDFCEFVRIPVLINRYKDVNNIRVRNTEMRKCLKSNQSIGLKANSVNTHWLLEQLT